ncbi:uncharacterized protein PG986_009504 [Apiospora aurea]|uniref:Uncharacterized protein n=1 Tax=Apiospora aurea TaxID=335848 RepID=A0ABR1Q7V2_9PEZI
MTRNVVELCEHMAGIATGNGCCGAGAWEPNAEEQRLGKRATKPIELFQCLHPSALPAHASDSTSRLGGWANETIWISTAHLGTAEWTHAQPRIPN